jgi:hypothetical protein
MTLELGIEVLAQAARHLPRKLVHSPLGNVFRKEQQLPAAGVELFVPVPSAAYITGFRLHPWRSRFRGRQAPIAGGVLLAIRRSQAHSKRRSSIGRRRPCSVTTRAYGFDWAWLRRAVPVVCRQCAGTAPAGGRLTRGLSVARPRPIRSASACCCAVYGAQPAGLAWLERTLLCGLSPGKFLPAL